MKFYCGVPNLGLALEGGVVRFKGNWLETDDDTLCERIKQHKHFGRMIFTEEEREEQLNPKLDPKAQEEMVKRAQDLIRNMSGVTLTPSLPQEKPEEVLSESPKPQSESSEPLPSLTAIARMRRDDLVDACERHGVKVDSADTVGIMKRRLRSFVKQRD